MDSKFCFSFISFLFFWLTLKWNLLPEDLLPSRLTQENTGLFEALGGWALGFAGALVAIRIAGLAANIQQNDSIREEIVVLDRYVEKVSSINSKITRSIYAAKRACAAVLIEAEDEYSRDSIFNNKPVPEIYTKPELEKSVQENLVEKLDSLIETIEEASRDYVYRSLLSFKPDDNESSGSLYMDDFPLGDYFEDEHVRKRMHHIVCKDEGFYDFVQALNNSSKNIGVGVSRLRSKSIYEYYRKDIEKLVKSVNQSGNEIESSEAAWLLLGILLLQNKNEQANHNHGFLLISLILGSLPNKQLVQRYLNEQIQDSHQDYTRVGKERLKNEIAELSEQMYYVKEEDLSEISSLFALCYTHQDYLDVATKGDGLSNIKGGKDSDDDKKGDKNSKDSDDEKK